MSKTSPRKAAFDALHALDIPTLKSLFEDGQARVKAMSREVCKLHFDWSKTHLDEPLLAGFAKLSEAADYKRRRDALFHGEIVNVTEGRPATHMAERGVGKAEHVDTAMRSHGQMRSLIDAIEGGAFGDVDHILHIGIGGSALGPALAIDALGRERDGPDVRILSNVDGEAFDMAVSGLDPASTLVIAVSKSFTTVETLTNTETAIEWLSEAGVDDPYGRIIAVSANPQKAYEFGIDQTRVLPFGEGVGGRYSLWSGVGLTIALAMGWSAFEELLEGAAEMDRHVLMHDGADNVALLAAWSDLLYTQLKGAETRAVFAYDERLRLVPDYLQQLEMESNGKSVDEEGQPLGWPSAPITWGGVGTDAQHAVFQLLHQGTHLVPVEFIASIGHDTIADPQHSRMLLQNCFAQGAALMAGKANEDGARAYPGDRPSTTILMPEVEPRTLGALLSFYEHRTFANAVLLGINPFDQFGVELGKEMARNADDPDERAKFDASTQDLLNRAGL